MTLSQTEIGNLYARHGKMVLRRAHAILGDRSMAEEVLHDLFATLVSDPEQVQEVTSFTSWAYGATTHRCLNLLRDSRNRNRLLEQNTPQEQAHTSDVDPLAVRRFIASLPEELAACAVHTFLDEMNQDEVAEMLSCSRRKVAYLLDEVKSLAKRRDLGLR